MPSWFPRNLAQTFAFVPLRIAFLVLVAVLARVVLRRVITRAVAAAVSARPGARSPDPATPGTRSTTTADRRGQRIAALGSLGRSVVTFLIFAVAAVMILSELGFDITSVVAGASVVAVTIAFGVQNFVKDFISGLFLLIEDQVGVGDWVDMEKATGRVEEIGLRVTQLRDADGTVWYVRNGEVVRVGNYSQGGPNGPPPAPAPDGAPADASAGQ